MIAAPSLLAGTGSVRPSRQAATWAVLVLIAFTVALLSLGAGAVAIPAERVIRTLAGAAGISPDATPADALVIWQIRLPRLLMGGLIGAALAVSGALMQGLFRNPLADPGLVGVSAGAAVGAAAIIVLGEAIAGAVPFAALPVAAFGGGLITTLTLYAIATREGRTSVATMLLAGIALGALAGAVMGLFSFMSDDRQLRDLTFWSLGSLGGATWSKLQVVAPLVLPVLAATPFLARGLNALTLGEAEAFHLGVPVQRLKAAAILLVAVAVGGSVASAGMIGFVGIVVPHVLRLAAGPDHRFLLPASALLGAALLVGADIAARTLVAPAELPIGILTALLGTPFFLWLLLRRERGLLS